MTWYEAYSRVCFKIWGNSAIPAGSAAVLQGDEGIIANVARKIQQEYNYWFMQTYHTFTTVAGTQAYRLPTDFKEPISAAWEIAGDEYTLAGDITSGSTTVTNTTTGNLSAGMLVYHADITPGTTISSITSATELELTEAPTGTAASVSLLFSDGAEYFSEVISPISTQDAQQYKWQSDGTSEYPNYYEINSDIMVLYPIPEKTNRVLHFLYWQIFDRPVTADWTDGTSTENDLLKFGADAVVNMACVEMAEILKEFDMAQYYERRGREAIELLKNEDRRHRQSMHYNVQYKEY